MAPLSPRDLTTRTDITAMLLGMMSPAEVEAWWITPISELQETSPDRAWDLGYRYVVKCLALEKFQAFLKKGAG